jgi:glycosyltransferase involved in cell wall biosynthesis
VDPDEKIRVGLILSSLSRRAGGIFEASRSLAIGLNKIKNSEISIFGLEDVFSEIDLPSWGVLPTFLLPTIGFKSFGFSPSFYGKLKATNVDIIHSHGLWMYPSIVVTKWAKSTHKPYLVSPHGMLDSWALNNSKFKKKLAGFLYEDAHLEAASCIHALSETEADSIRAYGLKNPICIIPNGVTLTKFKRRKTPAWRLAIPKDSKVLLFLGRIHPKKGLKELLNAWVLAFKHNSKHDWHLVIAGWGDIDYENEIKNLLKDLNIFKNIHFIGPQYKKDKIMCFDFADAFILPSKSEGLPMTILEAWSYGLPVLMTSQCNLSEGFISRAAIKINTNSASIRFGLLELFKMRDKDLIKMGRNGQSLVIKKFGWDYVAKEMLSVYKWILGKGRKPKCIITT